jgi:hypothetical protein
VPNAFHYDLINFVVFAWTLHPSILQNLSIGKCEGIDVYTDCYISPGIEHGTLRMTVQYLTMRSLVSWSIIDVIKYLFKN